MEHWKLVLMQTEGSTRRIKLDGLGYLTYDSTYVIAKSELDLIFRSFCVYASIWVIVSAVSKTTIVPIMVTSSETQLAVGARTMHDHSITISK